MKITRAELVEGFQILGLIGLLVGAFVIPSQWASGAIHSEAIVGIGASVACVFAAVLLSLSIKPAVVVLAQLLLVGGAGYVTLVPFVAAEVGWHHWHRIGALASASAVSAFIGWYGLRRIKRGGAQPAVQADGPASGGSAA